MTQLPEPPNSAVAQPDYLDDEIDLQELLDTLHKGRWLIALVATVVFLGGLALAILSEPVFRADVLLQMEQDGAGLPGLEELALLSGEKPPAEAEIQILKSRFVIGRVVDQLGLDVVSKPAHFPVVGDFIARLADEPVPQAPWFGLEQFAWGGEKIQVTRLKVPSELLGQPLALVAGDGDTFRLYDPEGHELLQGRVGEVARQESPDTGREVEIFVRELRARAGTHFDVTRRSWLKTVGGLSEALSVAEQGKGTGILRVSLESEKPAEAARILNAIANTYLRQNVERRSAQAGESLKFLEEQLPQLKRELEAAEQEFNLFRKNNESLDLTGETAALLSQLVDLEKSLSELQLKRAEMEQNFASQHPAMIALTSQERELLSVKRDLDARVKSLPETQQQVLRLQREVEVQTVLYTGLLNKAQELRVIKAGTLGNVRIVDEAPVPEEPVKPRKSLIAALSLFLGLFLGILAVFARNALKAGLADPKEIESRFGLPVYAVIPYSTSQKRMRRKAQSRGLPLPVIARDEPQDLVTESLRSLRTSLHFALMESEKNIIAITSDAPGSGKSFVSVNTAYLLGEAGSSVLLIDADMRRGHLHEYAGEPREPGLSDVLAGRYEVGAVTKPLLQGKVSMLSTGTIPPNPAELLMSSTFKALLDRVREEYDYVFIDTPPVLAVADAGIIGAHAGAVFIVVRADKSTLDETEQVLKVLRNNRVQVTGALFNAYEQGKRRRRGGQYGYYYYYDYTSKKSA